jgi:hypothetical protein
MAKIKVHRFRKYDIVSDEMISSTRMATVEKVASLGAELIPGSEIEIDESLIKDGWTKRHFYPN